jgi:hypothetical protein
MCVRCVRSPQSPNGMATVLFSCLLRRVCAIAALLLVSAAALAHADYDLEFQLSEELLTQYANSAKVHNATGNLAWTIDNARVEVTPSGARLLGRLCVVRTTPALSTAQQDAVASSVAAFLRKSAIQRKCNWDVPKDPTAAQLREWISRQLRVLDTPKSGRPPRDLRKPVKTPEHDCMRLLWHQQQLLQPRLRHEYFAKDFDRKITLVQSAHVVQMNVATTPVVVTHGGSIIMVMRPSEYFSSRIALDSLSQSVSGVGFSPNLQSLAIDFFDGYVRLRATLNL